MDTDLIPVRMLNEVVYCPRLFALEHVRKEWADNHETVEGRTVHRRVDRPSRDGLPDPEAPEDADRPAAVRSVDLGDPALGLVARIDLVEVDGDRVIPIDYKRGAAPDIPERAWEPERVQVCAQGLLLRAHGYRCDEGVLYFAMSRTRVRVVFTDELIASTLRHRDLARQILSDEVLPDPLVDSPKCPRCSLVGLCLPDETNLLRGASELVRPIAPARDDALPLYVKVAGGSLGKAADEIVIKEKGTEIGRARIMDTSRVVVLGNVSVSTPLLQELASRDVPVAFHSSGGWYYGTFTSMHGRNVAMRIAQHRVAADADRSLAIARCFVQAKIVNSRVLLRRNADGVPKADLDLLTDLVTQAGRAPDVVTLMGIEGMAARTYFANFHRMLAESLRDAFSFEHRNRRPPKDPVNALLSFAYATLVRELTIITGNLGLDPYVGFLHAPRHGKPALALDLMEEFRPIIADSIVITAINKGEVHFDDFVVRPTGVTLSESGRSAFLRTIERRYDELATHPTFGTRLSYRRILEVQARLLGRVLTGEIERYPGFVVR